MNALDHNRYTEAWRAFGAGVPRPRAIVVISAHWYINASAVTAMDRPRTIHDFYGFPDELAAMRYEAPGDPDLAEEIADIVRPTWVGMDTDSWGLDHGTWSVLVHAFPEADVPVVQLSINAIKPFEYHLELGAALSTLRDSEVLIIGSGNVVHNLGRIDWGRPDSGFDWARSFDDEATAIMSRAPADLPMLKDHAAFALASPTPDHFIPLLYLAGLASAVGETASVLVDGCAMGSLSMTSYTIGCDALEEDETMDMRGSPTLPPVPTDETNL